MAGARLEQGTNTTEKPKFSAEPGTQCGTLFHDGSHPSAASTLQPLTLDQMHGMLGAMVRQLAGSNSPVDDASLLELADVVQRWANLPVSVRREIVRLATIVADPTVAHSDP